MTEPLVVRPRRLTTVCRLVAVSFVVVCAVVAVLLGRTTGEAGFQLADQIAMVLFGLLLAGITLLFTRSRVIADAGGVRVRNVVHERAVPWEVVERVRFDEHSSWASLDLHDDDNVALFAVQANDGAYAVGAVQGLRRLLRESRERA